MMRFASLSQSASIDESIIALRISSSGCRLAPLSKKEASDEALAGNVAQYWSYFNVCQI